MGLVRQPKENVPIQVRVEKSLKTNAETIFSEMGLDTSSAIKLFLTQTVNQRKIPFEIIPSDDFYNPYNVQRLNKSIASLEQGKGTPHELSE